MVIISPYLYNQLSYGSIPFSERVDAVETRLTTVSPHLYDISSTLFGSQKENVRLLFPLEEGIKEPSSLDTIKAALLKEFVHVFRISVPYLIIFVPFGLVVALQNVDHRLKILFSAIIISLVVAFPQYISSAVFRNLFFLIPLFCILSAIGIEKLSKNIEMKNSLIFFLVADLIVTSSYFLQERFSFDLNLLNEKIEFGKFVVNNFNGVFIGDNYNYVLPHLLDFNSQQLAFNSNGNFTIYAPLRTFTNPDELVEYAEKNEITHIIVDTEYDNRYPIFQEIFFNEKEYPRFTKVFDSQQSEFKEYRVKIFRINYAD